jgi:NADH-quinone oxidoreductase subunit F
MPIFTVLICSGAACLSSGEEVVKNKLFELIKEKNLENDVKIIETGCMGPCQYGPVMIVYPDGSYYINLNEEKIEKVVNEHFIKGRPVKEFLWETPEARKKVEEKKIIPFFEKQLKIVLSNCGNIDPENIDEYIGTGGYEALGKVLTEMTPEQVIDIVTKSGLRGRGGAGFPTGLKWKFARESKGEEKFVICNGDEGDPGAFMDRSVCEGDPHAVLEGMAIAGYAIGANKGYIYIRAEYPLAVKRLQIALKQAKKYGLIGKNIFETGFNFDIEIRIGAGAFVCGEETALIASIEGKRGQPRPKPPFPAQKGLWGKPTVINNVETLANIRHIILKGPEWFASFGTEKSKGTKVFALSGKVKNTGLVEVPIGITLRELIFDIGGGIPNGKKFKAVQIGGPSGGCIPEEHLDTPIDYESLTSLGAIMGSGGLIVLDEDNCMVSMAKFFLEFTVDESCGQCIPCRVGLKRMYNILDKITKGKGIMEDLVMLEELAKTVKTTSLCGLGQTAPNPVLSTLRYFKDEYIEHIKEKKCKANICKFELKEEKIEEKVVI